MTEVSQGAANVELVERALVGAVRGADWTQVFADDAAWELLREGMSGAYEEGCVFAWVALGQRIERVGADGLRAGWLDWLEPWTEYRSEVEDMQALDDDRVLVNVRQFGRQDDGPEVEMHSSAIVTISNGRICRIDFYGRPEDAGADL
jgi:ketosteroid isomerase-like protein